MSYVARLKALTSQVSASASPSKPSNLRFEGFEGEGARGESENSPTSFANEEFIERGAIIEEGAGVPREWAEGFAKLDMSPVPSWVDAIAWRAMIDAAGRFLDKWGAKAAAAGWTAAELFGLDKALPMRRLDRRGVAFFLADARVIDVTADEISIRKGGAFQRIRHREGFTVPVWENPHEP